MNNLTRMVAWVGLALALGLSTACADASPTEPIPRLDPALTAALLPSVEDAASRLLPAIADAGVAAELAMHLEDLEAALTAGNGERAGERVHAAARLLAAYAAGAAGPDGPDVTAIRLMLAHTAVIVGAPLEARLIP